MSDQMQSETLFKNIADPGLPSSQRVNLALDVLGLDLGRVAGEHAAKSPVDGEVISSLRYDDRASCDEAIARATHAATEWRDVPAPRRGELVRLLGEQLRVHKDQLAVLVTLESGKIYAEALGEVQEMIDICDFAVGLSRQLYGLTMGSERPGHKLYEYWHPMGVVGVISAFNFPVAVWSWNLALSLVCGNAVLWKPSEKSPLTAIACDQLLRNAADEMGDVPTDLHQVVLGEAGIGEQIVADRRVNVVSATGSTRMGREVAPIVAARFGRCILELGGNNAMIVTPSADLNLALEAIVFSAVGTAGQRCTSLRRLIVHESIADDLMAKLARAYRSLQVGGPFDSSTLVGPLVDAEAFDRFNAVIEKHKNDGKSVTGGDRVTRGNGNAYYVNPAIVQTTPDDPALQQELFAPLLSVVTYSHIDEAIAIQNNVPQGLSSAIFSNDIRETERFLSAAGSDCGIANVNTGPSGAEIGGAFGGEKETGGGRESGSDAWKGYMRRMTSAVNYSDAVTLAQDISFDVSSD